jgi:hypothetical protein
VFTVKDLKILATIVNDFLCDKSGSYTTLMDNVLKDVDYNTRDALLEFFSYILLSPSNTIEEIINLFFNISLKEMPLYVIPKMHKDLKPSESLCPPLEEGPYPWQSILSRWRLNIQK